MRFEMRRIEAIHQELFEQTLSFVNADVLEGDLFDRAVNAVLGVLFNHAERRPEGAEDITQEKVSTDHTAEGTRGTSKLWSKRANILEALLAGFQGKTMSPDVLSECAWRCAASLDCVMKFKSMKAAFEPGEPEWVSLRIEDVRWGRPTMAGKPTFNITFRIFSGPFGGLTFDQRFPYKFWMYVVKRDLGFPAYKHVHKNEFVLGRLAGLLETRGLTDTRDKAQISEFYASGGMRTWNSGLRKWRADDCRLGYGWACHECTMGHSPATKNLSCLRGTHTNTYHQGTCIRCKDDAAWLDGAARVCVSCEADANRKMVRLSSYGG
jgi:hypothetical protein